MTDPKKLHEAAQKALEQTNYCTKHSLYHGQKDKSCTPQERVLVEVTPTNELEDILIVLLRDWKANRKIAYHGNKQAMDEAKAAINNLLLKARRDELQKIYGQRLLFEIGATSGIPAHIVEDRIAELDKEIKA